MGIELIINGLLFVHKIQCLSPRPMLFFSFYNNHTPYIYIYVYIYISVATPVVGLFELNPKNYSFKSIMIIYDVSSSDVKSNHGQGQINFPVKIVMVLQFQINFYCLSILKL